MATLACDRRRETAHDHVVHVVAKRFAEPGRYVVRTGAARGRRLRDEAPPPMPDIAGRRRADRTAPIEWLAEVETPDTLTEAQAFGRWRNSAALHVPMYLIVPKGSRQAAWSLAFRAGVAVQHVFEYTLHEQNVELS